MHNLTAKVNPQTGSSALLQQKACTSAEINCIAPNPGGNTLAAVDDDGYVTTIQSEQSDQTPPIKLNGMHDNICSSVVYRKHQPAQGDKLPCSTRQQATLQHADMLMDIEAVHKQYLFVAVRPCMLMHLSTSHAAQKLFFHKHPLSSAT